MNPTTPEPSLEAFVERAKATAATFFDPEAGATTMPGGLMQFDDGSIAVLALDVPLAEIGAAFINAVRWPGPRALFGSYVREAWTIPDELRKPGDEKLRWADDPRAVEVLSLSIRAFEVKRWFQALITTKGETRTLGDWRELERGDDVLRWGPFSVKFVRAPKCAWPGCASVATHRAEGDDVCVEHHDAIVRETQGSSS